MLTLYVNLNDFPLRGAHRLPRRGGHRRCTWRRQQHALAVEHTIPSPTDDATAELLDRLVDWGAILT
jgi:hypothetical protein